MSCNCKHMEKEIREYRQQIDILRKLFVQRMTVDSETTDRRRRDYNQAIFHYKKPEDVEMWNRFVDEHPNPIFTKENTEETYPVFYGTNMEMVLECFDNAVKDWRRTFCDVESCRRK